MNTQTYLTQLRGIARRPSVYAVAQLLEMKEDTVRTWYLGRGYPDTFACVKIAEVLDVDPMRVIAEVETDREKDEGRKEAWRTLARKLRFLVLAAGFTAIAGTGVYSPATHASSSDSTSRTAKLCIMSNRLRRALQRFCLRGFGRFPAFGS